MKLKKLISNNSHWTINKHLAKEIGLEATLILQHLIDWSDYHKKQTIFQTYAQIAEELNVSEHSVKKIAIPKLKKMGFISTERKGVGYKNYYTIHDHVILDFLRHPASEVESTPPDEVSTDSPLSEVNTTPLIGEIHPASEVKTTSLMGENNLAISNNIISKNISQESIYKETTTKEAVVGWDKDFVDNKILDVILNTNDSESKRYINAIEYYKEAGGFNGISSIMNWDKSQQTNWWRQLGTIENQYIQTNG